MQDKLISLREKIQLNKEISVLIFNPLAVTSNAAIAIIDKLPSLYNPKMTDDTKLMN